MRPYPTLAASVTALRAREVDAVISPQQLLQYASKESPCNLQVVGETLNLEFWAVALPKAPAIPDWQRAWSEGIIALIEDGTYASLEKEAFEYPGACEGTPTVVQATSLQPASFGGLFIIWGALLGLAVLCLPVEIAVARAAKGATGRYKRMWTGLHAWFGGHAHDEHGSHGGHGHSGSAAAEDATGKGIGHANPISRASMGSTGGGLLPATPHEH